MFAWFKNWFESAQKPVKKTGGFRPHLECLQERTLPSALTSPMHELRLEALESHSHSGHERSEHRTESETPAQSRRGHGTHFLELRT